VIHEQTCSTHGKEQTDAETFWKVSEEQMESINFLHRIRMLFTVEGHHINTVLFHYHITQYCITLLTLDTIMDYFADEQENDEEIGALGSILSWDDEDEAEVQASVAATTNALEACDRSSNANFMRQFSSISSENDSFGSIPMPNPINFASEHPATSPAPQAVNNTDAVATAAAAAAAASTQNPTPPLNLPQQVPSAPVPAQNQQQVQQQQQQALPTTMGNTTSNQFPTGTQPLMFPMFQQPMFNPSNPQQAQAMQFGMAQMMQAQQAASQQQQQPQHPGQALQQNQFNKVFLQQMQQAAVQAQQQAAQQFGAMQQSRHMAAMGGMMPQAMPSMPGILPVVSQQQPKKSTKRKATACSSQAPSSKRLPAIVSSSDTDGDTTSGKSSVKARGKRVDSSDDTTTTSGVDTAHMSSDEKAKANRDRNREHARNTRLRKKAYLEKLKSTVDELCRERDTLVSERAGAATLLVEMHNIRNEVLMSFFALRSANDQRRELWASILDESFACVMPVTPYRSFLASEVQVSKCQRTVLGIDSMMADTSSLHVLLNTLVDRSKFPSASIEFRYTLVTEDVVVAGNQMMARWAMSTVNAVQLGARMEVAKQGMLCAKFNSAHKIIGLELMFDVMAFMLQLKQATGQDSFSVVPNTVQTCQRSFDRPMVMTLAERPYTIVQVNKLWEDMTGYSAEDVVGKASCRILQGQETDKKELEKLMNSIRYKRPASGLLVNYTKGGVHFRNHLTLYPLSTDSKITHYVALTTHFGPADGTESRTASPNAPPVATTQQISKIQPPQAQSQLMQMVMPGPRPAPALAPLGNTFAPGPTMPHPPLGFFPTPVGVPSAMTMGKMSMPSMNAKLAPSSTHSSKSK
jgi:PAS domain S-box-containing protein